MTTKFVPVPQSKTELAQFRITPREKEVLDRATKQYGVNRSELIRQVMAEFLKQEEQEAENEKAA